MKKVKTIEEKYKTMSPIEHILFRSGMYIGSNKNEPAQLYLYSQSDEKMTLRDIEYCPGLLKLLDEIISNSCDEYRRKDNLGLTELTVVIDKCGKVTIKDNGGIPVVKHKEAGIYVPEFIFGKLRTSSNYDDTEERDVIGINGLGCKLCNIFSTYFSIKTADKKKMYFRSWKNNMQDINNDLKIENSKEHFTETTFNIDFSRFDCGNELTDDFIDIIEKRCIDAAAANIGLKVEFKCTDKKKVIRKSKWLFKSFEQYIDLYSDYIDNDNVIKFKDNLMNVWIYPDNGINIGFVNGAECSKGSHIKAIRSLINSTICDFLIKKKYDITQKNIDNKYSVFCDCHVNNPSYDSQTKDTLTTPIDKFSADNNYKLTVNNSVLKQITKSEIVDIVIDWYKQKQEVDDQKLIRKLNKQAKTKIRNNDKFIDANSKKLSDRQLWIFEGDSARAGFRSARNPQTQGAYLLRGVILNTSGLQPSKIMENKELSDLVTILGLQWGQKIDINKLNFSKIVIATDADFDGSHICGLLLNFFNIWPELFENKIICRSISPIIIATKGNDKQNFYTLEEFKKQENKLKGYKIKYAKGLGSLNGDEYKDMMQNPKFYYYHKDDLADMNLRLWFHKNIAKERKDAMKNLV